MGHWSQLPGQAGLSQSTGLCPDGPGTSTVRDTPHPLWQNCFSRFQKSSFSFPGVAVVNNQVFSALVGVECTGAEMRP